MALEGYYAFRAHGRWRGHPLQAMATVVARLAQAGIPPVFCFLADEFWISYARLQPLLKSALEGEDYWLLPDFWAWHVDPAAGEAGWSLHRDLGARSLTADGAAGALSVWIPLVPVDSFSGCIMLVPRNRDAGHAEGRVNAADFGGQDIRTLNADAGDVMIWSQSLLHWGSRGSLLCERPRISISMALQRRSLPAFNPPLLRPDVLPDPALRLELIAKQLLQYEATGKLAPVWAEVARRLLGSGLSGLEYDLPDAWKWSPGEHG
ncbi:MAG TPA: phytanoyl-CoA dioxygenase family protein [Stenotrophomonas sp.]|nr:phytanoyl-CoA dioxygenase family protein [Stenotrophomonas sp.]